MRAEALAVKSEVLWELSWALSLSPWELRATVCHMCHFWQGPTESSVFLAPLSKLQPQRIPHTRRSPSPSFSHRGSHTHTALPLAAPAPQNSLTAEPLPGMLSPLEARLCSPHKLEAA